MQSCFKLALCISVVGHVLAGAVLSYVSDGAGESRRLENSQPSVLTVFAMAPEEPLQPPPLELMPAPAPEPAPPPPRVETELRAEPAPPAIPVLKSETVAAKPVRVETVIEPRETVPVAIPEVREAKSFNVAHTQSLETALSVEGPPARGTVVGPAYLSNPKPAYPKEARKHRQQGLVLLEVELDEFGHPTATRIVQSSAFQLLDQAATNAVRAWAFKPQTVGGTPEKSMVEVPVRFSIKE
jgi:periplasmic protein TonB